MGTPASAGVFTPASQEQQFNLRFWAVVDAKRGPAPERALWRELLDLALPCGSGAVVDAADVWRKSVAAAGRPVDRPVRVSVVLEVGLMLYMLADKAGIIGGFDVRRIADVCRIDEKSARTALHVLLAFRAIVRYRESRRAPFVYRMNLGGLDVPSARARASRRVPASPASLEPVADLPFE